MSQTDHIERAATTGETDHPDDLFHIPADDAQDYRAQVGLPWRTLCGQNRPPSRQSHDWWEERPDDCAMCEHMVVEDEWRA